jgi:hypothetical protein
VAAIFKGKSIIPIAATKRVGLIQVLELMTASAAFTYSIYVFLALVAAFNILYFFVVLPRLRATGQKPGIAALFNITQQRYVNDYLALLTDSEKRKWHSVFLKHSFLVALSVWAFGLIVLVATTSHEF